ncbi:MAG: hypothetical protein LBI82_01305 [Dysgonamonadaceae bacterium]|jgi:Spy/CpxP family protein refolding chaperone|nr:hypothetical protein [Dysgonamonadaceae bacterium]
MRHISVLLIVFSLCTVFSLSAQNRRTEGQVRQDFENLRVKRIAFFSKEIGLTAEEAKEFWPIYNELEEKKFEVNRNMRQEVRKIRDLERDGKNVSAAEYDRITNIIIDAREKELELEREALKKIRKILSPEKVFKYLRAEHLFAREALSPAPSPSPGKR